MTDMFVTFRLPEQHEATPGVKLGESILAALIARTDWRSIYVPTWDELGGEVVAPGLITWCDGDERVARVRRAPGAWGEIIFSGEPEPSETFASEPEARWYVSVLQAIQAGL